MEEVRDLYVVADGDHLYRAPKDLMGRAPVRGERVDYKKLIDAASWTIFGARKVSAHYFQRRHMGGDGLYSTLQSMGYQLHLFPYAEGWEQVKDAILVELAGLRDVDCDVLFIGGDNYRGRFERLLDELQNGPFERGVKIVHLDGACQFDRNRFELVDLIRDLAAMPESIYEAAVESRQYPAGYPSSYSVGDVETGGQIGAQLQEGIPGIGDNFSPPRAEPLPPPRPAQLFQPYRQSAPTPQPTAPPPAELPHLQPQQLPDPRPPVKFDPPPAPTAQPAPATPPVQPVQQPPAVAPAAAATPAALPPAAPAPAPAGPRNILVLIDHENIDWSLGNLIGPQHLNADTRPRWSTLREFAQTRAQGGAVQFLSFLQHNDAITGFAVYLDGEEGFRPILLESEVEETTGRRRPVVDEAINRSLAAIRDRQCDVLVVSNDGGYLPHLQSLRAARPDDQRRFGVIGFIDEMSALYRQEDWIDVFDLERDVGAFTYELPRRYMPIAVDQFDIDAVLGDFGLSAAPAGGAAQPADGLIEFRISLRDIGDQETEVIQALREHAGFRLLEARTAVRDHAENSTTKALTREQADALKIALKDAGAVVAIEET